MRIPKISGMFFSHAMPGILLVLLLKIICAMQGHSIFFLHRPTINPETWLVTRKDIRLCCGLVNTFAVVKSHDMAGRQTYPVTRALCLSWVYSRRNKE